MDADDLGTERGQGLADAADRSAWRAMPPALLALLVGALLLSLIVSRPSGGTVPSSQSATASRAASAPASSSAVASGAGTTATGPAADASVPVGFVTGGARDDGRVTQAMALISFPWAQHLPGWGISFEGRNEDYYGMTLVRDRRIEIYVRVDQTPADLAGVVAHELGHAVDVTYMCWADRYGWMEARGRQPTDRWYVGDGDSDFASGAGDFAETFAVAQVGRESWSTFAGAPSAAQIDIIDHLADQTTPAADRC